MSSNASLVTIPGTTELTYIKGGDYSFYSRVVPPPAGVVAPNEYTILGKNTTTGYWVYFMSSINPVTAVDQDVFDFKEYNLFDNAGDKDEDDGSGNKVPLQGITQSSPTAKTTINFEKEVEFGATAFLQNNPYTGIGTGVKTENSVNYYRTYPQRVYREYTEGDFGAVKYVPNNTTFSLFEIESYTDQYVGFVDKTDNRKNDFLQCFITEVRVYPRILTEEEYSEIITEMVLKASV